MTIRLYTALVAGSVALASSAALAQTYTWDLANEYPSGSIHAQSADRFIEALAESSEGAISVTAHHGAALGYRSVDQFDAVGDGAVELASSFMGPWSGIDSVFLLPSLPFMAPSIEETWDLYQAARPYYDEVLEEANQMLLYATPWPPSGIWANKPVDSMEAVEGLRIRTYDTSGTVTMREAGASPVELTWSDTVPQLSTGGVNSVLTSADGGVSAQLWEHQSHFTEVNYAMPLQFVHMNRDTFEMLDDAMQEAVIEAAEAAERFGWDLLAERVQENYETMEAEGMTVVTDVSDEFLAELGVAAERAVNEWIERFDEAEALLADYEARRSE